MERAAISSEIAEYLNIDRELVRTALRRSSQVEHPQRPRDISSSLPPNEKLLLACLLTSQDARQAITQYLRRIDMLPVLETRGVFKAVMALEDESATFSVEAVSARVDTRTQKIITELSFADLGIPEDGALQQALHCLEALERKSAHTASENLKLRIRELERQGNLEEAMRLTDELNKVAGASERQNRVVL
jgi:hypothetical protein